MIQQSLMRRTALAMMIVAASCGSTDTTTEVGASPQDTAAQSTTSTTAASTTTEAEATTTTTSTTTEPPVDESAVRIALTEDFLDLVIVGDPQLADRMTPEERDKNVFGMTFAQFLVWGFRYNDEIIERECADVDGTIVCEWTSSNDWSEAIGFTPHFLASVELDGELVSEFDFRWNGGGAYGAMNRWRRANYPEEKACDPDPDDPRYEGAPAGALEWPEGEPIGLDCAALMVRLAPEFAASDSYIPPPERAG